MQSSYTDRKATIESDLETVRILVHEQADLFATHPKVFIDFLSPEYADRYRNLPRQVREYMDKFTKNGEFMVRRDIVDKIFGFKVLDITQLKILQSDNMAGVKRYAGLIHYALRQIVGYGKDRIVIAMPAVVLKNMFSNVTQLTMKKIPIAYTVHKILEGISEYNKLKKDTDEFTALKHKMTIRNIANNSPDGTELARLDIRIKNNKLYELDAAGVNSIILENVNASAGEGFFTHLTKIPAISKVMGKVPTSVNKAAGVLFLAKTSRPYQLARHVVQLTDFLARYVMVEYAVNVKQQPFKVALHDSLNSFVVFDETLTPAAEALDAIGATSFMSYYLRNQRSSRNLVQSSPTAVGLSAAVQYATGIETLGNINSSFFGADFSPNMMQVDELFGEVANVTGAGILADLYAAIFG